MAEQSVVAVIPARYGSTRFPGKVLAKICGKSMIEYVWRRVSRAETVGRVIVATDDERVAREVGSFGGHVAMTRADLRSGSDRVAEVARDLDARIVLNVQADEPLIDPRTLDDLVRFVLGREEVGIATVLRPIRKPEELLAPSVVKAAWGENGRVLYFSRSPIPFHPDPGSLTEEDLVSPPFFAHLGVYAYRKQALLRFTSLPESDLERRESLEQLRALAHGLDIFAIVRDVVTIGVDLPSHVPLVEEALRREMER
jgi:3-deoxy-manno-octulosonate cytidylyltransferase (CMP-KDO synthetase)